MKKLARLLERPDWLAEQKRNLLSDAAIARQLKCKPSAVREARLMFNLPTRIDQLWGEEISSLSQQGFNDAEIAAKIGCSSASVVNIRKRLGVKANKSYQFKLDPNRKLANTFEEIAEQQYFDRGYSVSRAHHNCKFDFLVNGVRVDVKGANPQKDGRFRLGLRHTSTQQESIRFRCDVIHGIIKNGKLIHLLIPASELPQVTQIEVANTENEVMPRFKPYIDNWQLLSIQDNA